jgi:hypothetical protein
MERRDYYQLFGLPRSASQKEITRAYRRLARRFHPDLHPPERKRWAEERMKRLNEAYAVLRDPEARSRYTVNAGFRGTGFQGAGFRRADDHHYRRQRDKEPHPGFNGSPKRTATHPVSAQWKKISTIVDFIFWMLVVDFLVAGAVLMAVEWDGLRRVFEASGLQCIFLGLWWVLLFAALFKMVPIRRRY